MHKVPTLIVTGNIENQARSLQALDHRDQIHDRFRDLSKGRLPLGLLER